MTALIVAAALVFAEEGRREPRVEGAQAAVEAVRRDFRVQRIDAGRGSFKFDARFNDRRQAWNVEIISGGREVGFASVKDGEVVELDWKEKPADKGVPSPAELLEGHPAVREIRKRFPNAAVSLAPKVEGEGRAFEIVANGRELAAGAINVESGEVQFFREFAQDRRPVEPREVGGFWQALRETCRFPVQGAGLVWFAAAVTLLAVFPFRRPLALQSLDVLVLLALFPLSLVVWGHKLETFLALFALTGYLLARCVCRSFRRCAGAQPANLAAPALAGMLLLVAAAHVQAVMNRGPDDSGIWAVFGGQYVWRHGRLPYGQIGEGGTYGPLLYAVAAPLTHILPPTAPANDAGRRVVVDRDNVERVGYQNCDFLPAKLLALAFDVLLIAGLISIGRQEASWTAGLSLALVYAVNGLTIQRDLLFISHLAPTAFVVLAIATRSRPVLSGGLLALGAGMLFWPAFLIPMWLAYYAGRGRASLVHCGAALAVIGVATLAAIYFYTEPVKDRGPLGVFMASTWEHQEGGGSYGRSQFGLWGQWIARSPDQAAAIANVKRAVRWSYLALSLGLPAALYFFRKPISPRALLAASATLALGLQFWKTHGGGLYTGWHFPLVIATLFLPATDAQAAQAVLPGNDDSGKEPTKVSGTS